MEAGGNRVTEPSCTPMALPTARASECKQVVSFRSLAHHLRSQVDFPDRKSAQELSLMTWEEVMAWLARPGLSVDESVRKVVEDEKVLISS